MRQDFSRLAAEVYAAQKARPPRLVTAAFADAALADAYAIQIEVAARRIADGDKPIGFKVGCTSRRIQAQIRIQTPIWGRLFASHELKQPATVRLRGFAGLAVEGELAVELNCDPRELQATESQIAGSIQRIFPVIELHHFAIPPAHLTASTLVANNAIHAGFVVDRDDGTQLSALPAEMAIRFNDELVATVPRSELVSLLLSSLAWLRDELTTSAAPLLEPPVTVLCGSAAELFALQAPTNVQVALGSSRHVQCHVA